MSSVSPLFIPRKDYIVPGSSADWKDFIERQKTNDLAIERWANQQPLSARATGGVFSTTGGVDILPLDTVVWDPAHMVDLANDWVKIPVTGIFLMTGIVNWNIAALFAAGVPGQLTIFPYYNGALVGTGVNTVRDDRDYTSNASPAQGFTFQYKANIRDTLQIAVQAPLLFIPPQPTAQITELTVTMLGRIPSAVQ